VAVRDAARMRIELKGAVLATVVNVAETPVGTPVAERPTGLPRPPSRTTETVVTVPVPPATVAPAVVESDRWKVNGCVVVVVVVVLAGLVVVVVVLEVVVVVVVVALEEVLVLVVLLDEVEVDDVDEEEDDVDDWLEDDEDKKLDDELLTEVEEEVEVEEVELDVVVVVVVEPVAPWIASKMTDQLSKKPFQVHPVPPIGEFVT
jgi:hypothetical protein